MNYQFYNTDSTFNVLRNYNDRSGSVKHNIVFSCTNFEISFHLNLNNHTTKERQRDRMFELEQIMNTTFPLILSHLLNTHAC